MTRLSGVWAIDAAGSPPRPLGRGRVEDVEALCLGVIRNLNLSRPLNEADELDLLSHLFEQTIRLAGRFKPAPGREFRPWLYRELQRDAIDYLRSWHGRRGEKRVVDTRKLDAAIRAAGGDDSGDVDSIDPMDDDGEARRERRLAESLSGVEEDDLSDRVSDLRWLHDEGSRAATRTVRRLGLRPGAEAAPGDRAAARPIEPEPVPAEERIAA